MERQVHHLNRLVDDLLEVSRITRGIIEVRKEPLDLTAIVSAAIETSRPGARQPPARADRSSSIRTPMCVGGDPVRLTQVFANLLNNAAKYTNHGGRHLDRDPPRARRGRGQRQGRRHRHRAERAGAGVRHVHAGRSLDAAIAGRTRHRPDAGAEPRRHARRHRRGPQRRARARQRVHRPVAAAGRPGTPSTAQPRRIEAAAVAPHPDRRRQPRRRREPGDAAARARRRGRARPQRPRTRSSASTTFKPDVVLLDIGMPGMDGYEVARRIRANPANRDISLIALTGWGQDEDRRDRSPRASITTSSSRPTSISWTAAHSCLTVVA